MKQYLAVFTGTSEGMEKFKALDEATRKDREQKGMMAWGKWMADHSKDLVFNGSPLGKTKLVSNKGINDIRNNMGAFVVVQAESHEAAAKMFIEHPHFTIFPGDGVEVMECLPIPSR